MILPAAMDRPRPAFGFATPLPASFSNVRLGFAPAGKRNPSRRAG